MADSSICDIRIENEKISKKDLPKYMPQEIKDKLIGKDFPEFILLHQDNTKNLIGVSIDEESDGTQMLFYYSETILDTLEKGNIMVVDEINDSMHPLLVRFLIGLFHNKKINKNNAQLVFSTHDTTILDKEILRRDQVWFVEKDKENSTQLYPLSDFKARNDAVLGKNYLQGHFGAIPYFGEFNI